MVQFQERSGADKFNNDVKINYVCYGLTASINDLTDFCWCHFPILFRSFFQKHLVLYLFHGEDHFLITLRKQFFHLSGRFCRFPHVHLWHRYLSILILWRRCTLPDHVWVRPRSFHRKFPQVKSKLLNLCISTFAMELIEFVELTFIGIFMAAALPCKDAFSSRSIMEFAIESVRSGLLDTFSFKNIVGETSAILDCLRPVLSVCALGLIVMEITEVVRPICEDECTFALCSAIVEVSDVEWLIFLVHFTKSMRSQSALNYIKTTWSNVPTYTSSPYFLTSPFGWSFCSF